MLHYLILRDLLSSLILHMKGEEKSGQWEVVEKENKMCFVADWRMVMLNCNEIFGLLSVKEEREMSLVAVVELVPKRRELMLFVNIHTFSLLIVTIYWGLFPLIELLLFIQ